MRRKRGNDKRQVTYEKGYKSGNQGTDPLVFNVSFQTAFIKQRGQQEGEWYLLFVPAEYLAWLKFYYRNSENKYLRIENQIFIENYYFKCQSSEVKMNNQQLKFGILIVF